MKNLINWFEIPATDFNRAVSFYKSILGWEVKETEMEQSYKEKIINHHQMELSFI